MQSVYEADMNRACWDQSKCNVRWFLWENYIYERALYSCHVEPLNRQPNASFGSLVWWSCYLWLSGSIWEKWLKRRHFNSSNYCTKHTNHKLIFEGSFQQNKVWLFRRTKGKWCSCWTALAFEWSFRTNPYKHLYLPCFPCFDKKIVP